MSEAFVTRWSFVEAVESRGAGLRRMLLATVLIGPTILGGRAFAAGDPADATGRLAAASSDSTLEEVVVTAEKRSSTVQKTPISVTAITGQDLQSSGITSAQGIVQSVPGIAISSAGPGQAVYEIRGLSADGGESPTIGFYLDEIPITPPAIATTGKSAVDPDLYDLARVEVLRGPQGTLYGSGSMGGTVKLVTNSPDARAFYGSAESTLSGTEGGGLNYSERAMLNLPLSKDTVALRLVATDSHTSGWLDRIVVPNFPLEINPAPGVFGATRGNVVNVPGSQVLKGVNDEDLTSARASLLITPTGQLSVTASIFYQRIHQNGMNTYDSSPGTFAHYQPFDVSEPYSDRFTLYSLTVNYDFDAFSVTSATGYWTRRTAQFQDASEATQSVFQFPAYTTDGGLGIGPAQAVEIDTTSQSTEEIRLASRGDGPLKWLVGGYFSHYDYTGDFTETPPGFLTLAGAPFPTDRVFHSVSPQSIKQTAGFANASYNIAHQLTFTAGARYFSYDSHIGGFNSGIIFTGTDAAIPVSAAAAAHGVTPMANIAYSPDKDRMLYATAAKGFREGAGNVPLPTTGPLGSICLQDLQSFGRNSSPLFFDPDTVWTYEVGEKGRFFGGRMTVNGDVFYTRWSKVQQPVSLACGLGYTDNGADAAVKGGELEIKAQMTNEFSLIQNLGYARAAFTQDFPETGVTKGQSVLDVPRWTLSTTLQYVRPLSDDYKVLTGISNSYVSSSQDLTYIRNTIPGRDITNFRLGVDAGKWTVSLFVNNILNRREPTEFQNLVSFTGPPYNRIATNQPLTGGVAISLNF